MTTLAKRAFQDEPAAFEYLEMTLWPEGAVCPHCGTVGNATKLQGKATRMGVWKCNEKECRKQFTVKVGTVFEHGRIPLHKMLQAVYLLCCSKKGCSSHQLHRILGITYKSAWFLSHRIREAMKSDRLTPMGGIGSTVEIDETYIGRKKGAPKGKGGGAHKNIVLTLVERGGSARSFHVDGISASDLRPVIRNSLYKETAVMTDEAPVYDQIARHFSSHEAVNHSDYEWARGDVHTNTIEGFFSIFKRGMKGVYQHCSEKHLHRYLAEFDFRYSNRIRVGVDDLGRTVKALQGAARRFRQAFDVPDI
jgi:transposase-like protein